MAKNVTGGSERQRVEDAITVFKSTPQKLEKNVKVVDEFSFGRYNCNKKLITSVYSDGNYSEC